MIQALKDFYKWSPVIANALLGAVILLLYVVQHKLGGPEVDMKWLIGLLGLGQIIPNYKSVTPNANVAVTVKQTENLPPEA